METEGFLEYKGRAGDHVHCTVEPSPGHIQHRKKGAIPPPRYYLERVLRDMGGVSRAGPLSAFLECRILRQNLPQNVGKTEILEFSVLAAFWLRVWAYP